MVIKKTIENILFRNRLCLLIISVNLSYVARFIFLYFFIFLNFNFSTFYAFYRSLFEFVSLFMLSALEYFMVALYKCKIMIMIIIPITNLSYL